MERFVIMSKNKRTRNDWIIENAFENLGEAMFYIDDKKSTNKDKVWKLYDQDTNLSKTWRNK